MKKGFLLFLGYLLAVSVAAIGRETILLQSQLGAGIEFDCSCFEPGQIILVRLAGASGVKKVIVRFLNKTYVLEPAGERGGSFAFIGLDIGLPPGSHAFDITVSRKDGRQETLTREFSFSAREFPVKKLWVKEKYVTPPPEVRTRIQWEAELLEAIYGVITPRWLGDGAFVLPNPGEMAPNFGERRIYNNVPRSTHAGVDILAASGSPVRAANAGRVVLARDLYFSGKTVILDHGLGLFTSYCHFSRITVKRGQIVRKGDVVGLVGSTGRSTGPHLHWGVKIQDSRVDPLALLSFTLQK